MAIQKDINELLEAAVISPEVARSIEAYYAGKKGNSSGRMIMAFGILGAILCGLGTILIIAHNWDELSRPLKTMFAFVPILIGQAACLFTLLKRRESQVWREASSGFLFFAVGASISLVSQIYNIPGNISSFMLTWMLLTLPLVYLLRSSATALFFLIGISYYAMETGYFTHHNQMHWYYWPMLAALVPHYIRLLKEKPGGNFTAFLNWLMPASLLVALGTVGLHELPLLFVAYIALLGLLYIIGNSSLFRQQKLIKNGYMILGLLGMSGLLLNFSFEWVWSFLPEYHFEGIDSMASGEFISAFLLTTAGTILLIRKIKSSGPEGIRPFEPVFLIFIPLFMAGVSGASMQVPVNLLVLALGVLTIREGTKKDHLGIINYGLLLISALVACRFFDSDLSFVARGILFVLLGIGFFMANYWILKNRKEHAN